MKLIKVLKQKRMLQHKKNIPEEKRAIGVPLVQTSQKLSADEQFRLLDLLTPRERDLFVLLLEGYTLKESSKQLSIKYSTANTHMMGIYRKLNVSTRTELIIRYRDAVKVANEK